MLPLTDRADADHLFRLAWATMGNKFGRDTAGLDAATLYGVPLAELRRVFKRILRVAETDSKAAVVMYTLLPDDWKLALRDVLRELSPVWLRIHIDRSHPSYLDDSVAAPGDWLLALMFGRTPTQEYLGEYACSKCYTPPE